MACLHNREATRPTLPARRPRLLWRALVCASLGLLTCACAAMSRPPETGRPRAGEPPYPVTYAATSERREQALANWTTLAGVPGATRPPAPELQPVTATLRALPSAATAVTGSPLHLPKVGGLEGKAQTEEELRESLRRFISSAAPLLGVAPEDLSLVERKDNPDGTKRAHYQQKPFTHPLRGGFGALDISFAVDGRVLSLSSTAIPDAERLRRALAAVRPQLTAQDAATRIAGRAVSFNDADGRAQTLSVGAASTATVRELVVYPRDAADAPSTLALHLAWEVAVTGAAASPLLVYVDAVNGETIAAIPGSADVKSQ